MQHTEYSNSEPRASNLGPSTSCLLDYLITLFKHRRMIFLSTLSATIITVLYTLLLPNIYTAKTMILPVQDDKGMMTAMIAQLGGLAAYAGGAGVNIGGPTTTDLYVSMLKSEAVKDPIIARFKLGEVYGNKYLADSYNDLDKNVEITAGKKDGIITISVQDKNPQRAAAMANSYVRELGGLAIKLNVTGAGRNRRYLEERLTKAKLDLVRAENDLSSYQAKNKILGIAEQAKATIESVAQLKAQLAFKEVQLASLRAYITDENDEIKTVKATIENLAKQISRLEGDSSGSSIPTVGAVPPLSKGFLRYLREFKIQESLVELLTKQLEITKLTEAKDISPFQVIQSAKVPERKSKPKRAQKVILATFTVFFLSVLVAFIRENAAKLSKEDKDRWREIVEKFGSRGTGTRGASN